MKRVTRVDWDKLTPEDWKKPNWKLAFKLGISRQAVVKKRKELGVEQSPEDKKNQGSFGRNFLINR